LKGRITTFKTTAKKILTALIPEDQQVMNVGTYDLENTDLGLLLDDAQSSPFFGDYRLVIANNPVF
jgi:DNA polymerase III, delta subunit.